MKLIFPSALTLSLLLAAAPSPGDDQDGRAAIVEAIENFAGGADARDAERIARSLHPRSWQYMPAAEGLRSFNQEQYLALIRAGKIGGQERELTIEAIDISEGYLASARVELRAGSRVFLHHMGLMKVDGTWQILSILTLVGRED